MNEFEVFLTQQSVKDIELIREAFNKVYESYIINESKFEEISEFLNARDEVFF